jgi:hypothetical protein
MLFSAQIFPFFEILHYMRNRTFIFSIVFLFATQAWGDSASEQVRDGDIIFQTSMSSQSQAIQRATGSRYSHMGIIFLRKGSPYVFEAIKTVQYTSLDKWIRRGQGKHFVVKRFQDSKRILTEASISKLKKEAQRYKGKPYDLTFEWSDDRIYCSELVWKIYDRALNIQIGRLQKLRDFNLTDALVQQKMKERYGNKIPLTEPVISPGEMFQSPNLITVMQR